LILCAVPKTFVHRLLSLKYIVGIGLISYSAYLWHQPLLAFARHKVEGDVTELHLIILCITSLLMAWFSWRFVEKPFRNKNQTTRKSIFTFAITGMIIFTLIGIYIHQKNGFFDYFIEQNSEITNGDIGHDEFHMYTKENYAPCSDQKIYEKAENWYGLIRCQQSSNNNPTVAVFGDSHAEHLFLGLDAHSDYEYIYLIRGGRPFSEEESHQYLIDYIINNKDIKTVIYSMFWHPNYTFFGEPVFKDKLLNTINLFTNANKNLILVADIPDFIFDAKSCYFVAKFNREKTKCEISFSDFQAQRKYLPLLKTIATDFNLELIDPSALFCEDQKCSMVKDQTILYRDNDHLNIPASRLVGEFIVRNSIILDKN
jgi:hypothetical protein